MDAKDSLKVVLEALRELKKQDITRQTLIDFVRGNDSRSVKDLGLDALELFGSGDKREELHYSMVIDQAVGEKLLKEDTAGLLSVTQKGERFRKSPTAFVLREEGEENGPSEGDNAMLDILVEKALHSKDEVEEDDLPLPPNPATAKSQQMIHLIQAIDRKIPLDDYAEQMQLDFDEVLDTLEALVHQGVKLDISYFINEILDKDCQQELLDYFAEVDGDVERTIEEFDGVYQPEEIRLMRLMY